MAHGHIIISKGTFRDYILSDEVAAYFNLPLELPDDPEAESPVMIPQQWTLFTGFKYRGGSWEAGAPFPVIEDENGAPARIEGGDWYEDDIGETDWVVPINAQIFDLAKFVSGLAAAKPIPIEYVQLRACETLNYLADGSLPVAPV